MFDLANPFSLNWHSGPIYSLSCDVVRCVSVPWPKNWVDWRLLVEEHIANIGIHLEIFCVFFSFNDFWVLNFLGFASLQTSLLCIMGELAGGQSVARAVSVSDK